MPIPSDFSGLVAWHEAQAQPEAVNDPVATLVGLGGKPNSQTQGNGSQRPILVELAGGQKALRFDAVDDSIVLAAATAINARPLTVHVVYAARASGGSHRVLTGDDTGSHNWLIGPYGGTYRVYTGAFVEDGAIVVDAINVHTLVQPAAGDATYYIDGVSKGTSGGTNVPGVIIVGRGPFGETANSDVLAVVTYDEVHSDTDRNAIIAYLDTLINPPAVVPVSVGGAITPVGTLAMKIVRAQSVGGAITPVGSVRHQTSKMLGGVVGLMGALTVARSIGKWLTGAISLSGSLQTSASVGGAEPCDPAPTTAIDACDPAPDTLIEEAS